MIAETIPGLAGLSSDDKILLAAELWQEAVGSEAIAPDPELIPVLRERLAHYHDHPGEVSSWEEVRRRILALRGADCSGRTIGAA
jgi:hypothetical protein